jgi:hypothetical protein
MRAKYVTGVTVTDLGTTIPFVPGNVVAVLNPGASSATLQFGDASTGPFTTARTADGLTAAVIPAGGALSNVLVSGRYAAIEGGSGQLQLVQN